MSVGQLFMVIALLFFFLAGTGLLVPYAAALAWGLFSLTLGFLLGNVSLKGGG